MDIRLLTKHYFISGRVQGVGFRAFVQRIAGEQKMLGWVRNLPDGRVETLVQGTGAAHKSFEASMRRGPLKAEVKDVVIKDGDPESIPQAFEVRKDGR